jgi:hypothetical protein
VLGEPNPYFYEWKGVEEQRNLPNVPKRISKTSGVQVSLLDLWKKARWTKRAKQADNNGVA